MKKLFLGLLTLSLALTLCACVANENPGESEVERRTASSEATATAEPSKTGSDVSIDLTGPWHLDSEKNDLTAFQDIFPAYAEFGAGMEIKSDGQISWYIGAEGGSGTYTLDGDTLTADIVTDVERQQVAIVFHVILDGETAELKMKYNDTTVYWIYGDSGEHSYGNTASAYQQNHYQDTEPPVITLNGERELWIKAGQEYSDAGCTAQDASDGDLTGSVTLEGSVNSYRSGDYTLTYSAVDSAGNTGTAQRIVHVEPQPQPDVVTPEGKVVYLTFDDGPGPYTQALLDVLEAYNVKATFFVTGYREDYQHLIGAEHAAGHSVGIHSYSHEYDQIYASEDAFFADLDQIQAVIEEQTGQKTTLMRFPGGSSNTVSAFTPGIMTALVKDVMDMGFQYFDWNVVSGDAGETTSTDVVIQNMIDGIQQFDTSIVLQHDIKEFSVNAVESILAWGIQNGYTFLPLTSSSPTAHHGVNN